MRFRLAIGDGALVIPQKAFGFMGSVYAEQRSQVHLRCRPHGGHHGQARIRRRCRLDGDPAGQPLGARHQRARGDPRLRRSRIARRVPAPRSQRRSRSASISVALSRSRSTTSAPSSSGRCHRRHSRPAARCQSSTAISGPAGEFGLDFVPPQRHRRADQCRPDQRRRILLLGSGAPHLCRRDRSLARALRQGHPDQGRRAAARDRRGLGLRPDSVGGVRAGNRDFSRPEV